jgi:hypothetical protein
MLKRIITFYCFCDDFLKVIEYPDNSQAVMSTAEIMTVVLVAAEWFGGCFEQVHERNMVTCEKR